MFGTMRTYEFIKIQSRIHKLEVYSHFFFFDYSVKKYILASNSCGRGTFALNISINLSSMAPQTIYIQIIKCALAVKIQL